ncbi:dihydropteroate synthase [Haloprofundus salilacus]|uniref:dihydropteroate synthase n=1 Tax=Haloprofundus salilacus TaxID=2876190 RepID=UPI001CCFECE5|nr:dihydropteroate synthase [Haloprofundus salilacus]
MEYHESVEYLESLQRSRPKLGTETTRRLLSELGSPHRDVDCVQIAGSNGKGSTACMLERVLREAGLDVGLYTSPDLNDLRERIRVNGRTIPRARVSEFVEEVADAIEQLRAENDAPTYFEVLTAMAFSHFDSEAVDVAVLEVGIGGRYDATSVIDPVASAVTNVTLEHTDILGDTVEEIARDKAQVAPSEAPLVTGAKGPTLETIRAETDVITVGADGTDVIAREEGLVSEIESAVSISTPKWSVETKVPLPGQHQATNAGIAAALAEQVAGVEPETLARGLRSAHWPGRFEIMSTQPLVVLDGAHNPGACETIATLVDRYEFDDLHLVFGAMREKDHEAMAEALTPAETAILCEPAVDRAEDADALATVFDGRARRVDRVDRVDSVLEAIHRALSRADHDDCVLVTGSLYVVAEARDRWTSRPIPIGTRPSRYSNLRETCSDVGDSIAAIIAESADSRTLKVPLRELQAEHVKHTFESVGGSCLLSTQGRSGRRVTAILSGTVSQFRALVDALPNDKLGLAAVSTQLARAVDGSSQGQQRWSSGTAVMGVLNVTPDSFYDGGVYDQVSAAVERANEMVAAGADIVDIGGESTRPGADPITVAEEIDRVVPVIERLSGLNVPISVDTRKAAIADAALEAGADIVNDVSGLDDPEMRFVAADHDASLVITHSLDAPVAPDRRVEYDDVVEDVRSELQETLLLAERAGLDRSQLIVDPGFGFGKRPDECFELLDRMDEFRALDCPILVGHSRKSMFERVGSAPDDRLPPTLAVTTMAAERGVDVIRVHDVAENVAALRTVRATLGQGMST